MSASSGQRRGGLTLLSLIYILWCQPSIIAFAPAVAGHSFYADIYTILGTVCDAAIAIQRERLPYKMSCNVKDLAREYDYLSNTSEFFFDARRRAEQIVQENDSILKGNTYPLLFSDRKKLGAKICTQFTECTLCPRLTMHV